MSEVDENVQRAGGVYDSPVTVYFTRAQRAALQRLADETGRPLDEQIVEMLAQGWGPFETVATGFRKADWSR